MRALPRSSTDLCVARGSAVRDVAFADDELYDFFNYPRSYFYASLEMPLGLLATVSSEAAAERVRWLRPVMALQPYEAADRVLDDARLDFLRQLQKTVREERSGENSKGLRWSRPKQ